MASYKAHLKDGKLALKSLNTFCIIGVGSSMQGESLEKGLSDVTSILPSHSNGGIDTAALLSSFTNGYLYNSAVLVSEKKTVN